LNVKRLALNVKRHVLNVKRHMLNVKRHKLNVKANVATSCSHHRRRRRRRRRRKRRRIGARVETRCAFTLCVGQRHATCTAPRGVARVRHHLPPSQTVVVQQLVVAVHVECETKL
jgi:hypothetical protein